MTFFLKELFVCALVCVIVFEVDGKDIVKRPPNVDYLNLLTVKKSSEDVGKTEVQESKERGIMDELLSLGAINAINRPNFIRPPLLVPQGGAVAPTLNIPNVVQNYPSNNKPASLGGLLSSGVGLLNILDINKDVQLQKMNMEWIKYAVQKCAKFDTRKLTTILPSSSNGLNEPKLYFFANTTSDVKTWEDANKFCTSNGMDLATINDAAENSVIRATIKNILANSPVGNAANPETDPNQFWIGLQDPNADKAYNYVGDGSSSYTDWHTGAPTTGTCVSLTQQTSEDNIHMLDHDCVTDPTVPKFRYVCEVSDECMGLLMSLIQVNKKPNLFNLASYGPY